MTRVTLLSDLGHEIVMQVEKELSGGVVVTVRVHLPSLKEPTLNRLIKACQEAIKIQGQNEQDALTRRPL